MRIYYWEDLASSGWDIVAHADSEAAARSIAKEKIALETTKSEFLQIAEALESRPTAIFHYGAALCIFTECDPVQSRYSREAFSEMARQMRDRASFAATASMTRLLHTWADVLDQKPDVGWAVRNREDIDRERSND